MEHVKGESPQRLSLFMNSAKILLAGLPPDGIIKPTDETGGYPTNTEERNTPCFR